MCFYYDGRPHPDAQQSGAFICKLYPVWSNVEHSFALHQSGIFYVELVGAFISEPRVTHFLCNLKLSLQI